MGPLSTRLIRGLLLLGGSLLLLYGVWSLIVPRARFVSSSPSPGATIERPPSAVTVAFSRPLDPQSTIEVLSTISLSPSGEQSFTDGATLATTSGLDAGDARRRTLRVELPPELPGGLYVVRWTAMTEGGRARRFGTYYFGVGMPVPEHIMRDVPGALQEQDHRARERRSVVLGGVILLGLVALLPRLAQRR